MDVQIYEEDVSGEKETDMLELESESVDVHELIQKVGVKNGIRPEVLAYLAQKREVQVV